MAEPKTKRTNKSVTAFLNSVADAGQRKDSFEILKMLRGITKAKPEMWGESIVGFGRYNYRYSTGRTAEWPLAGFSPRKQNLTLYLMPGFSQNTGLLKQLGKYKTSFVCLYIKRLAQVDKKVLHKLLELSYVQALEKHR